LSGPSGRILVIEDDREAALFERTVLENAGYEVTVAGGGSRGLELAESFKPDVIVLDVGISDVSGFDVCASLANSNPAFIVLVSGNSREQDVLLGLGLGADDFLAKPISGKKLVARVAAFLRRREKIIARTRNTNMLDLGSSRLERDFHTLANNGSRISLTALEFRLMWFMGEDRGRLLTRAQILECVWNDTSGVPTRVVDVHVAALRKKLVRINAPLKISSVRGIGYRLDKN
jgi:two-component system alkaline phosphatase synthesis response regulator PhoP